MNQGLSRADWETAIAGSYRRLVDDRWCEPEDLWEYPGVVLCHDTSADPRFVYANRTAQRLWQRSWDEFVGWPSRLTAPVGERAQRAQALAENVVVTGYQGVRVNSAGEPFMIRGATVWPVHDAGDPSYHIIGQAATFTEWNFLSRGQFGATPGAV